MHAIQVYVDNTSESMVTNAWFSLKKASTEVSNSGQYLQISLEVRPSCEHAEEIMAKPSRNRWLTSPRDVSKFAVLGS